jgi:tRNA U34 5-carboxymethylaminomethyl modifying GTPase MnmE/TrmE
LANLVQMALAALDELVGVVDPDEILGRIFSRFCVGK